MHEITVSKFVKVKPWQMMRYMTHVEDFPKFMPNVKQSTVLEKGKKGAVTCWVIEFDKLPLSWKEQAEFDFRKGEVRFHALEGDLEKFEGKWSLIKEKDGTRVNLEIRFQVGIPKIESLLGEPLGGILKDNFEKMLDAIEERHVMGLYKNIRYRKLSHLSGFAVIGHPYNFQHLVRYFQHFKPDFKMPSREVVAKLFDLTPAYKSFDITEFKSKSGRTTKGYFIMCPIIPDMVTLSPERVVQKVGQACKVAEKLGVGIVTLGGFTSIAGEKFGKALSDVVNVPVTTGNTFTVALTMQGIYRAAELMGTDISKAKAVIIGGNGDIGGACAKLLSERVHELVITGRNEHNLMENERVLSYCGRAKITTSLDNNEAIKNADIILAAASTSNSIIDFNNFKPGAIVCDVGYPKNISYTECKRDDILIFSGGIAKIPTPFDVGFDVGMPSTDVLYGCFSESILLDLEERYENFSWGKGNITREKIDFISKLGEKHGFELAPFFWGNKKLTEADIAEIRNKTKNAGSVG